MKPRRSCKQVRATHRNFALFQVRGFQATLRRIESEGLVCQQESLHVCLLALEQELLSVKP